MGFLTNLFSKDIDNVELALQLFETQMLGGGNNSKYQKQVDRILKDCTPADSEYPERQEVLLKIIELIGEPKTPKERFIVAKAYAWSRANYRTQAIKYLELYLNDDLYEDEYSKTHHNIYGRTPSLEEEKNIHIADILQYLGKAYEGEYEFEKALKCYEKENELIYFWPHSYANLVNIYTKMNMLDKAFTICKQAKKSPFYKKTRYKDELLDEYFTDDTFKSVINDLYKDTKEKIEKRIYLQTKKKKIKRIMCIFFAEATHYPKEQPLKK